MTPQLAIPGSEVRIGRVGFGCARIATGSEFRASAQLVEAALAAGIRHFDTAPSYGGGLSEALLGDVLAGVPDVTITTKIGLARPDVRGAPSPLRRLYRTTVRPLLSHFPGAKARLLRFAGRQRADTSSVPIVPRRELSRDEVLRSLDESLRELKRAAIDIYLLHEPAQFEITDELRELFGSLQRQGAIGAFGVGSDARADPNLELGSVIQGRYDSALEPAGAPAKARIFHGVLRHAYREHAGAESGSSPGQWFAQVLRSSPDDAFLFSASSGHQIAALMKHVAP